MFNGFNLEENSPHRRILLFFTVIVVVGYAWVGSRAMQAKVVFPRSIVARAKLVQGNHEVRIFDAARSGRLEVMRAAYELGSLASVIGMIGGMERPIELIINADEPLRYQVDGSVVEVGSAVLSGRGQLSKAILKAWLQQRASDQIVGSLLRLEVASDLLLALLNGRYDLESVETGERLSLDLPANWLASVASTQGYCASPWRSLELNNLCLALKRQSGESVSPLLNKADRSWVYRINPLALRPVLSSVGWKLLGTFSLRERLAFIDRWTKHLIGPERVVRPDSPSENATLEDWRTWTRNELVAILDVEELADPGAKSAQAMAPIKDFAARLSRAIGQAGLSAEAPLAVQAVYQVPALADEPDRLALLPSSANVNVIATSAGAYLLPGAVRLAPEDLARLTTRWLVWESCATPRLHELIEHPLPAARGQRVLFVEECGKPLTSTFAALSSREDRQGNGPGMEEFVRRNKSHVFVQLQRSAVLLAVKRGLITSESFISDLLKNAPAQAPTELGVHVAQWNRHLQAYRVLGAVEAVEWFRMGTLTAVAPGSESSPSAN
jgi:hypothetical protein